MSKDYSLIVQQRTAGSTEVDIALKNGSQRTALVIDFEDALLNAHHLFELNLYKKELGETQNKIALTKEPLLPRTDTRSIKKIWLKAGESHRFRVSLSAWNLEPIEKDMSQKYEMDFTWSPNHGALSLLSDSEEKKQFLKSTEVAVSHRVNY